MTTAADRSVGADDEILAPPPIDLLPWHAGACDRLSAAVASERMPHGLLLQGPAGVGKDQFASALAAALFCTGRGERLEACGQCAECQLSRAGTHPDLRWVRPLEDKKSIGVDQVREMCEKLSMTSMRRGYRLAIIVPADNMTPAAQNALLKTLEEPGPRTVLVLVAARPSALLATLRSRCQRIEIARPEPGVATRWLQEALGRPVPPRLLAVAGGAATQSRGAGAAFRRTRTADDRLARRVPRRAHRRHARGRGHAGRGVAGAPGLARGLAQRCPAARKWPRR